MMESLKSEENIMELWKKKHYTISTLLHHLWLL